MRIKLRSLLREELVADNITAADIYNFYYLWYIASTQPKVVATNFGNDVMKSFLYNIKGKYIRLFKKILVKQITKYIQSARVDQDFPKEVIGSLGSMSSSELKKLMAKTFRSDMKRRNDKWDMVAEYVSNLENASSVNDIFLYVNQLNNAVHNTQTKVMDKFPNFYSDLKPAFDAVDKIRNSNHWEILKRLVTNKDIRDLLNQEMDENKLCGSTRKVSH